MNSTSTNESFYSLDFWFSLYGYTYIVDIIVAYFITPVWFFSLILSIFSLYILLKAPFLTTNFFNYIRLYVVNCLILSLLSLTTILVFTRRFFVITNRYEGVFYGIYIFFTAQNSFFLFSSCIEICLVVERILYLLPTYFRRVKLLSFNNFFIILFINCILVNLTGIFLSEPSFVDVQLNANSSLFRIWYFGPTSFSYSTTGVILNYLGYIFRDFITMTLNIILNLLSVVLVRKYVQNKQKIRAATTASSSDLANFDRKQTYIALLMSTFSLLEHVLYIISYFLFFINYFDLCTLVYAFALLFIALKHAVIFFVLFAFNNLFRNAVKKFFNL